MKTIKAKTLRLAIASILAISMLIGVMPMQALSQTAGSSSSLVTASPDITNLPWMDTNVRIANGTGDLVIEGYAGATGAGGTIDIWTYWPDSTYYQWRLVPDANHEYVQLRRYTTTLASTALAPTGGTVAAGTRLTLATASNTADNQWWKPELQANGRYIFSNKANPNLIMQPITAASQSGIQLAARPATIATSDTWRILNNPDGTVLEVVKPIQNIAQFTTEVPSFPLNTPFNFLGLPTSTLVTYVDGTQATRALTWNQSAYNGYAAGMYYLTATVALDGMETNPNNVIASRTVSVGGGMVDPTYAISASSLTSFGSLQTPYTQPTAQTVTVTNTGTGPVTLIQPTATNYIIGTLSTDTLAVTGATATFTVQPKAGLAPGVYDETITIPTTWTITSTVKANFTVLEEPVASPTQPKVNEVRIISNGMIELWWDTPSPLPANAPANGYYMYSQGHPDSLKGAGSSANFFKEQETDRNNFEIKLDGTVLAQRTGSRAQDGSGNTNTFSPYYWHTVNYSLHGIRQNQHITTLRLNTNLTTAQMTALENGTSTITVQVVGDVTNRAGEAADKTKILTAIWKPYYDKVVTAKTGFQIKGSAFVDIRTLQKAADITDKIMSSLPEAVVERINTTGAFLLFGPGEHSGNIPEQRNVISSDQFNRAEGYGGDNAATSAANVERCNITRADGITNRTDYYPDTYRTGYAHESILAHEFGHKIHSAFNSVYSTTNPLRLEFFAAFDNVVTKKMWTDYVRSSLSAPSTSANRGGEYFATMTSVWHNAMSEGNASYCNTRGEFEIFDAKGYEFFAKLYGQENTVLAPQWDSCPNTGAPRPGSGTGTSALGWDEVPFENPLTRDILSAAPQVAIKVPVDTAIGEITLPAAIRVNYTDSNMTFDAEGNPVYTTPHLNYGTDSLPVVWDTSSYISDVAGIYTFEGTIQLPTRILTNTNNVKASIAVEVQGEISANPLESIKVTTPPLKTVYTEGEPLDLEGLVVTATYGDESTKPVVSYTTTPANGTILNTVGTQTVTVRYAQGGIAKTAVFTIKVVEKIELIMTSSKTDINKGDAVTVGVALTKQAESNVVVVEFAYDVNLFQYTDYSLPTGVDFISKDVEAGLVKLTLMVQDYKMLNLASFNLVALKTIDEDIDIAAVGVSLVTRDGDGKTVVKLTSELGYEWRWDVNDFNLIMLSNTIDHFGKTDKSDDWDVAKRFDFNKDNEIGIMDIFYAAQKVKID